MPIKIIEVKPKMSDAEFKAKYEGTHFDEKETRQIINEDADVYGLDTDEEGKPYRRLLAKFRKGVIPQDKVQIGWDSFRTLAMPGRNRGAAAGPIDLNSVYWKKRKPIVDKDTKTSPWAIRYLVKDKDNSSKMKTSKMRVNNLVASGVLGFYEETPFMKAACRMTVYTRRYLHLFLSGMPFIKEIDTNFSKLVPKEHARQLAAIQQKKKYQIPGTAFSTITVNLNFRTALHKDDGDFKGGFGNLSVIEWGKYHGGYTLFPRFGIGFDVRTGDFIAMDVHEWHCNTPMYETPEDATYNRSLPDIRSRDPTTGLIGSEQLFQRLTFVCYFRDKLQKCDQEETDEYYDRLGFDEDAEIEKAKAKPIKTLLLPQYNEMEDVLRSLQAFGKTYRQRIPEGATRKLQKFMNSTESRQKLNTRTRKIKRL
jgi:hypothetical protein